MQRDRATSPTTMRLRGPEAGHWPLVKIKSDGLGVSCTHGRHHFTTTSLCTEIPSSSKHVVSRLLRSSYLSTNSTAQSGHLQQFTSSRPTVRLSVINTDYSCHLLSVPRHRHSYKKLSYRRVTARCVLSVVILPVATQQCRNYLYDKS